MSFWEGITEKLNPVQPEIARDEGDTKSSTQTKLQSIQNAYELVEVVNRTINILVDNSALIDYDIGADLPFTARMPGIRSATLNTLLNFRPNPYMDISTFRRLILMDFLIDGNSFIFVDGTSLYHLPANAVTVLTDSKGYISGYEYEGHDGILKSNEVIFVKDNSTKSVYRGDSRINSAMESLLTRESMTVFQKKFFDNGAAIGMIVETEQMLSRKLKDRQEREWVSKFNPKRGHGRPLILDSGMKARNTGSSNFKEMAFTESISNLEEKVCYALGVPPILLSSGNNANIKPNLELMFYTTIIPMIRKFEAAFELFFGRDIQLTMHRVPSLKPDLKEEAERISSLVNNGIITGNEGRVMMRLAELDDPQMKNIRIPANVAGSATGVTGQEGGKPPGEEE